MVGPVGPAVGAKVGPVRMNVTPAGNLSFGIAHHLIGEEERGGERYGKVMKKKTKRKNI